MPATNITQSINAVAAATPGGASVALVARQPIYGTAMTVVAYELQYADSGGESPAMLNGPKADTLRMLADAALDIGLDRLAGTLLGTALGDAPGRPVEGMSARAVARRFGRLDRFRLLGMTGFVSDDTEQAALVAQSLARHPDDPGRFVRVHRSWIVPIERLSRLELVSKNSHAAVLSDGTRVPVSREGYARLRELLGES